MSFTHALSTNRYGESDLIVSTNPANGTHVTLALAMAAATSGQTIFLRDSVTENVTLTPGVNISAWTGGTLNTPTITGTLTMTGAGTCNISGIRLQTNSAALLAVTGSAASIVNLTNCYLNCTNNTGITFSSSDAGSKITLQNCNGNIDTTGISLFTHTSGGILTLGVCNITNSGGATTASTASAGALGSFYSFLTFPVTTSGTNTFASIGNNFNTSNLNSTFLTCGGSGANNSSHDYYSTGTATAISIGSSLQLGAAVVVSNNTSAISGAGTLQYTPVSFIGTSSNITTTTQNVTAIGRNVTVGASSTGVTNIFTVTNSSDTASSNALVNVTVGGTSAGDAFTTYTVAGMTNWSQGVDNSASDAFVLAASTALGTTNVMSAATTGEVNWPLQPAFLAYLATTATDKTGAAATYTLGTDALTEVFDQGSDFNTNGTFTAPITGKYQLNYQMRVTGCTIASAIISSIVTSNRNYVYSLVRAANANDFFTTVNELADMDVADTATYTVVTSGEAGNTDDIFGGASVATGVSGYLVA